MKIRRFTSLDFELLQSWAKANDVQVFDRGMLPSTTYLVENEGRDMASLSLITTNTDRAYLEYALGNPELKGAARREAFAYLVQYVEELARGLGYKTLSCLSPNDSLGAYYTSLGYQANLPDLCLMLKELN